MLQGEHSAILSTFIKLPFIIKILILLSFFEWPLKTGFTVCPTVPSPQSLQPFTAYIYIVKGVEIDEGVCVEVLSWVLIL